MSKGRLSGRWGGDRSVRSTACRADRFTPVGALDIARGKARTAVIHPEHQRFREALKDGTMSAGLAGLPGVTPLAGVVIHAGGSLLSAVGASGAPGGDKDENCAKAGLTAVQDKLEF
jgi:uncharacterized protein GlcG (DUF336 family)